MAISVIRVTHADLAGPVTFTDDEVLDLEPVPFQAEVEEVAQTGELSHVRLGVDRMDLEIIFRIRQRDTLDRLDQIHALSTPFTVQPFVYESPATTLTMVWPGPLRERWHRGRRRANWDLPVIWRESTARTCADALVGS